MSAADTVALNLLDPHSLLSSFGAIGVFVVLFAETGLLIGLFLPGDSPYGAPKAIVLARFIPLVRTVMSPLAGIVGVAPRSFAIWQVIGGVTWSAGVTMAGYLLGSHIPGIDTYLLPIIALIVAVSLIPVLLEVRRARAGRQST